MTKTVHGIIRGKVIELAEDLGVAEGQEVEVQVTVVETAMRRVAGDAPVAGALADDAEWDVIMEEVHRSRKLERRPQREEA